MSGIDRVIQKAAMDLVFFAQLTDARTPRREVAKYFGIELSDIEAQLLESVSREQLQRMILAIRPQFTDKQLDRIPLGGGGTCTLDHTDIGNSLGIRPDRPSKDTRFGGIRPDKPKKTGTCSHSCCVHCSWEPDGIGIMSYHCRFDFGEVDHVPMPINPDHPTCEQYRKKE